MNAAVDALADQGVRHINMPVTAEKVWRALQMAHAPDPAARSVV